MPFYLNDKSLEGLRHSFIECWPTVYLGLPNVLRHDQEDDFKEREKFTALADAHGGTLQFYGIESQNSISKGDRYIAPLRRVFNLL